ncbi:MAG: tRNA (guanosine(46)-N7)-methyltransferase TrmB [Candidatus Omnitrophica bacterium]|nr:tRNA (guanosine(46)-N7)-methyltransferase TrmB [Candidatus Omnitrophota bacterium]
MRVKPGPVEMELKGNEGVIDFSQIFQTQGPLEIEVGCGKGRFLVHRAGENPDRNFLGLEYARAYFKTIANRCEIRGLRNVRVVRAEAFDFFRQNVPDHSVSAFHLLYPDPWPKKRHHKRRLIRGEFLAELRRTLVRGAIVNIATDHRGYFDWMCEQFDDWKGTFVLDRQILSTREDLAEIEGRTNYEVKYIREGRPLHFITGYRTGF